MDFIGPLVSVFSPAAPHPHPHPPRGAAEISHQSHESDNDLGDNNREEEKREGEKRGQDAGRMSREVVVRECFCSLVVFLLLVGLLHTSLNIAQ